ncbi:protein of unknown function [Aquiflexum balticum DSM 16537]|uniref:DUF4249 domain-containing protein n=1 Tax=Aquiflexum balticum DSM 16537 TaxID=758820 RepID=A0A1W2H3L3_9BACT|nr:DUF4249 domain-containing protein [Aquiflexum balticum]SMD43525.1 protein of unknown function [Aquiflexum balticum DSM 16537]
MKRRYSQIIVLFLFFTALSSCRDPFEPEVSFQDSNLLVIEGYIETASNESIIRLSRTNPINSQDPIRVETGAYITLLSETGESWSFFEKEPGTYSLTGSFNTAISYRLQITLRGNEAYISDPIFPLESPEITEIGFNRNEDGVQLFVSARGNENAVYFIWDYEETWIFRAAFPSSFIFNPQTKQIDLRRPDQNIHLCWNENKVNRIVLENSSRFSDYLVNERELVFIPNLSEKLMQRYSINVRQRVLSKEAFDFWEIMRKNTEDIGGIFSPLPSLIKGNISPVDPKDPAAIGFVSMGKSSEKRHYINVDELRPWPVFIEDYARCEIFRDTIPPSDYELEFSSPNRLPVVQVNNDLIILGFQAAETRCADCTLRGTTVRPDFWED